MADPLSAAAAVVGLADVAFRASKELYTFFAGVNNASRNVQTMITELLSLEAIFLSIKKSFADFTGSPFSTDDGLTYSGVEIALEACQRELDSLQEIVRRLKVEQHDTLGRKLSKRIRWSFSDKPISQSSQRLERLKLTLTVALADAGRQNDISLRNQLKFTREEVTNARHDTKIDCGEILDGVQQSIIEAQEGFLQTKTKLHESSSTLQSGLSNLNASNSAEFSTLRRVGQTLQDETVAIQGQIRNVQTAVGSGHIALQSEVLRSSYKISEELQTVQKKLNRSGLYQQRVARRQIKASNQLQKDLSQVQSMLTQFASIKLTKNNVHGQRTVIEGLNLETITMPLLLMKSSLPNTVRKLVSEGKLIMSNDDANLFMYELNSLLAASHEASALALIDNLPASRSGTSASPQQSATVLGEKWTIEPHVQEERSLKVGCLPQNRKRKFWSEDTPAGVLIIELDMGPVEESQGFPNILEASFAFVPHPEICKTGVSTSFMRAMNELSRPVTSRHIRSFDVIKVPNGQPTLDDALNFLDQVKVRLPSRYSTLLDIMIDFKTQAIDTPGLTERILELFYGYPEIIQSFSYFLPVGYKIEVA